MNTTENISFASKITTGVKRSSSSIVQQEEIGGLETTTVTISTSSHHIESKLAASITQQGPIKKKAKPELSAAKPIPQGTPSTASNTNSGRLRVQALSSVVRLEVPLEVTKSSISNFFNNLKIQHIYALAHSKEIGKYSVYVKFETISGAELALEQSMETLKFVVGQSISSVEAVVESVGKLEAILVCGMCLRMRSKDSSGKTLNELMSRDYMTAFQPLFCIELLSSYEHFVEQYNSVNLCSEAMSANQFAEVLQSQFDFKNVGVNDWIASQLLQPTLFSFHAIGSSSSLLEIQSVLEKMKEKLIGFWNCRAVLEKIKTDELAVSDFELIECVTQSIHLHETLFALFWRVMINDQLPEL